MPPPQVELDAFKAARDAVCAVFPDLVRRVDVRDIGRPVDTRKICRTAAGLMFEHVDALPEQAAVTHPRCRVLLAGLRCGDVCGRAGGTLGCVSSALVVVVVVLWSGEHACGAVCVRVFALNELKD